MFNRTITPRRFAGTAGPVGAGAGGMLFDFGINPAK
jgi:hypothetical protein